MRRQFYGAFYVGFTCLLIPCCQALANDPPATGYPAVDCVIQPSQIVDLGSPVSGVIAEVLVQRSDFVRTGDPIARLDDNIERATVELAIARTNINAQVNSETINMQYDQKSQRRIDSLYGRKVIPIENKDDADRDAQLSQSRLTQIMDLQVVRNLELERARKLVGQKVIRSSIDGFVVTRFKSAGEFIEDQPILRIAQLDPLHVEAILPMQYFGLIQPGMQADVSPEVVSAGLRQATVIAVDRVGDAASGSFGVRLAMPNPGFDMPAGLKCEVKFLPTPASVLFEAGKKNRETIARGQAHPPKSSQQSSQELSQELSQEQPLQTSPDQRLELVVSRHQLGPFTTEEDYQAARASLEGYTFTHRQETIKEVLGYRVISEPDNGQNLQILLIEKGIQDYYYLPQHDGRYSLGFYSIESNARLRQDNLENLGISTSLEPRIKDTSAWWLDVSIPATANQSDLKTLRSLVSNLQQTHFLDQGN